MKQLLFKAGRIFMLALVLCFVFAAPAMAQNTFPNISDITPENVFQATIDPLYSMLVILFGYLSGYLPVINKAKPFTRVFAFALALGIGLHLFGGSSMWKLAFSYFMSSGLYVVFLKNIFQSPKAID